MPIAYRGRFAPSPTGPLHFGSLVAAVASFADARHHAGEWLVRIEDVDETRRRDGAEQAILQALNTFGMVADQAPVRQSARKERYAAAVGRLAAGGWLYPCTCSRSQIAAASRPGIDGPVYPGTCRGTAAPEDARSALRVKVDGARISVSDRVHGVFSVDLPTAVGDFVVRRRDGFHAYQLAVVVDDREQGITHVVRGADLLWSTPRQAWLQRVLGYPAPAYAHVPLVIGDDGRKLSKRDAAHPVDLADPVTTLRQAWSFLGQSDPPPGLREVNAFWRWAAAQWRLDRVPRQDPQQHDTADVL